MNKFFTSVADNALFVLEFVGIVLLLFVVAYVIEKIAKKKNNDTERILSTRKIVVVGIFSAISALLMLIEFGLPVAPAGIYKMDFSELPALIVGFAYGPVAGVMTEFIKVLLKTLIKGTSTAFVGELASFVVGCGFILPATIVYSFKKNRISAVIACVIGTIVIAIVGSTLNAFYLIPTFAKMYGMDIEVIVGMGTAINSHITSVATFALFAVAPFNLIKGTIISVITLLIYKRLSPIIKATKKN